MSGGFVLRDGVRVEGEHGDEGGGVGARQSVGGQESHAGAHRGGGAFWREMDVAVCAHFYSSSLFINGFVN